MCGVFARACMFAKILWLPMACPVRGTMFGRVVDKTKDHPFLSSLESGILLQIVRLRYPELEDNTGISIPATPSRKGVGS